MFTNLKNKTVTSFTFTKRLGILLFFVLGFGSSGVDLDGVQNVQDLFDGPNRASADTPHNCTDTSSCDGGGSCGGGGICSNCVGGCSNSDGSSGGNSDSCGNSSCGASANSDGGCAGSSECASSGTGCGLY